jgi:hypothetical protein
VSCRRSAGMVAAVWTAVSASVAAANFWDMKPYTEWSQKEVETLLSDSPWVRKLSVVVQTPPRATDDAGGGGGRGGGGGDTGGRGFPIPSPQLKLTLTWRSALPVRQAFVRASDAGTTPIDAKSLLQRPEQYLLTLSGVPVRYQAFVPSAAQTSFLKRAHKPPIPLLQGGIQQDGRGTVTLIYAFPRTDPIALDDQEVEFVTAFGTVEIKQKFKLKDLAVHGELDL